MKNAPLIPLALLTLPMSPSGWSQELTGKELVYVCSYDGDQSHATLKIDPVAGKGTLTNDTPITVPIATNADATKVFCERMTQGGQNCADYSLYCLDFPKRTHNFEECMEHGAVVLNNKDLARSFLLAGSSSSEAKCAQQ